MRGRELKFKNLSEKEKGYLFGLFEGDGYKLYNKKSRHYSIEWYLNSVKDKQIINFLKVLLNKLGLTPNLYQDKRFNCKRIRVYSKELFSIISKNINLIKKTNEFNLGFISGLIDSEGYISNKKSYIVIINTNKNILNQCKKILNKMNIYSSTNQRKLSKKDKLNSYRMYISVNFKRLNHLSIKAGKFQSGVETS
jgi:hypothetical protein